MNTIKLMCKEIKWSFEHKIISNKDLFENQISSIMGSRIIIGRQGSITSNAIFLSESNFKFKILKIKIKY